jgi:hypothetical protein
MKYNTKSAIIGRMGKRDEDGNSPVFVHLFKVNDPHKTDNVPEKFIEFEQVHKIIIKGLDVSYLIAGSDILVNDLEYIEVKQEKGMPGHVWISGKQKK